MGFLTRVTFQIWFLLCFLLPPSFAQAVDRAQASVFRLDWKDEQGKSVHLSDWQGKPMVISMAYTSCRMYCPLTIRQLKKAAQELTESRQRPEIFFVTLDPVVDTPRRLAHYKAEWKLANEQWHFLAGSDAHTESLAKWLGIRYQQDGSHFIHDNKIIVIDAKGRITRTIEGWDNLSKESLQ